jgi:uncharacterized protein
MVDVASAPLVALCFPRSNILTVDDMALLSQRIVRGLIPARFSADRPPAQQTTPDRIVFGVRKGHRPSTRPPVRIYLGTERGQFRAERVFLWSVEKHRDPSRIYEIYLMRDLKGFRRGFWLTGFTNYRFAIPAFAGFEGRAIYNDADQVYLTDPAELFDTPMDKAGFMSINDRDTSVMLIDCERMAQVWNEHDVRRLSRKALEARARQAGLWGDLDDGWNARDSEYVPGASRLVHFTTLHTQPWRPFPDQFVYFNNPTRGLWPNLEKEADQAGFLAFSATRPSRNWANVRLSLSGRDNGPELQSLFAPSTPVERRKRLRIDNLMERVPDQDVAWVLERLFDVSDEIEITIQEPMFQGGGLYRRSHWYWIQQFQQAGRLRPETRWCLHHSTRLGRARSEWGGPAFNGDIVVLLHRKPGHNQQARTIAVELARQTGRPVSERTIECGEARFFVLGLVGLAPLPTIPENSAILVAGGWLPTRVARTLAMHKPQLRLVLSGRKAGPVAEAGSVIVQCKHFGLPPHPRRLLTTLPLNAGLSESETEPGPWQDWLQAKSRAAVLVGGSSRSHRLTASQAELMARRLSAWAEEKHHRLLVVSSRRSQPVLPALAAGLGANDLLYAWRAGDPTNPYGLALTHADKLVVTGESESMLADAAGRDQSFLIWPLPEKSGSLWRRFSARVAERAVRPRFNRRGSIRPQQGLTYLCARALERNWVLPPRRLDQLHDALGKAGLAARFGQTLPTPFRFESELEHTVGNAAGILEIATVNSTEQQEQFADDPRQQHP